MISLRKKQNGFTIVELLIVIVLICILAAIVATIYSGVQKRERDRDRIVDLQAISSHIEVYFVDNSKYPTLAEMNDTSANGFIKTNLKGLKLDALADPASPDKKILATTAPDPKSSTYQYAYVPTPANCDNAPGNECTGFTLTANLENDPTNNHVITGANN